MRQANLQEVQKALDTLRGHKGAEFGFFLFEGRTVYTTTIKQVNGDIRYGSGDSLTDAYIAAVEGDPLPRAAKLAEVA